jgi:predicted nucleotidyltransferase
MITKTSTVHTQVRRDNHDNKNINSTYTKTQQNKIWNNENIKRAGELEELTSLQKQIVGY